MTRADAYAPPPARDRAAERRFMLYFALAFCALWGKLLWESLFSTPANVGPAVGTDFLSFYAASILALKGQAALTYDPAAHDAAQKLLFSSDVYYAFFYPPMYLLLCLPLALLPYYAALATWLAAGFAGCAAALRRLAPDFPAGLMIMALLASPAAFMNISHGQNAFITTGLFAGAIVALDRRPLLAGTLFGLLIVKPHFGLLLPLFLAVSGRWKQAFAAAAAAIIAMLAATALFGPGIWQAYAHILPNSRLGLEENRIGYDKMVSIFAMARLMGASVAASYLMQAAAGAAIALAVALTAWRVRRAEAAGAVVAAGALLVTPFLLRYDLMMVAIPLIWIAQDSARRPLRAWEFIICGLAYALPIFSLSLSEMAAFNPAPVILAALFALTCRRALAALQPQAS